MAWTPGKRLLLDKIESACELTLGGIPIMGRKKKDEMSARFAKYGIVVEPKGRQVEVPMGDMDCCWRVRSP